MYFNAIECDGELSGMFVYWDIGDFYYLEHLAVFPEMRNKKIGQQVLDYVAEHLKGVRLLEGVMDMKCWIKLMCSLLIMRWKMLVRFGLWEVKILPGWLSR